jgi:hypothetical protein
MYIVYINYSMDGTLAPGPTRLGSPCSEELVRAAKIAATSAGMRFNEWIKLAVEEKLGRVKPVEVVPEPVVKKVDPNKIAKCDVCSAPCVQWGPSQRHCTKCSRNFPLEAK